LLILNLDGKENCRICMVYKRAYDLSVLTTGNVRAFPGVYLN